MKENRISTLLQLSALQNEFNRDVSIKILSMYSHSFVWNLSKYTGFNSDIVNFSYLSF